MMPTPIPATPTPRPAAVPLQRDVTIQDTWKDEPCALTFRVEQVIRGPDADRIVTYGAMYDLISQAKK